MPYKTTEELPLVLHHHDLPEDAQDLYMEVFWKIWEQEIDPDLRHDEQFRKELAHRMAMAAVRKAQYEDNYGQWLGEKA